jgi:hypothetical protein
MPAGGATKEEIGLSGLSEIMRKDVGQPVGRTSAAGRGSSQVSPEGRAVEEQLERDQKFRTLMLLVFAGLSLGALILVWGIWMISSG